MNAFNWSSSPRATTDERKGTITIDPNPEASRAKQARLIKGAGI